MSQIQFTRLQISMELPTKFRIENQSMRSRQSRHIESLARRHESHTIHSCLFADHSKRTMLVRRQCQVGVDFIREDQYPFFVADFGYFLQFFFGPYHSTRIVRIAENKYLASLDIPTECLHIHAVHTIYQFQRIGYQRTVATGIQPMERTIYRRLNHHLVSLLSKGIQCHTESRHDAWYKVNHFLLHFQSITYLVPINNRLIIAVRFGGISQHRMFTTFLDSFGHKRSGSKVHIGYPKRNQIRTSPQLL